MGIRAVGLLIAIVAVATLMQPVAPASATSKTITCSPANLKIVTSKIIPYSNTLSETYVDVPEATVSFVQGGSAPSCVIVRFSAQTFAKGNGMTVRPLMDVNTRALPAGVQYAAMDCSAEGCGDHSYSFEFVFPSVAPGTHLLRMQYHAAFSSGTNVGPVYIGPHNMVVQYK